MLYAKVVFGLPIEGPFDYIIPKGFENTACAGRRVIVTFGREKKLGYITGIASKTRIKKVKPILQLPDSHALINADLLALTKELSEYYCCSWGQAIDTALPESLKKLKPIQLKEKNILPQVAEMPNNDVSLPALPAGRRADGTLLIHCVNAQRRWNEIYFKEIQNTLNDKKSVIILLPDKSAVYKTRDLIAARFDCLITALIRNQPDELKIWLSLKQGCSGIIIGTRSAVFAPVDNLGLIIIDEENQSYGFKQDQTPHYDARQIARMRAKIENAILILGSSLPSLESIYLARKKKIGYTYLPCEEKQPNIKILDMKGLPIISHRKNIILSKYLQDSITRALADKSKILLFLNRLGFATTAICPGCKTILHCPRCGTNLVLYYTDNILSCRHCNYKIPPPKICPSCNSGYIHYLGAGVEKVESEIARLFPQAKVYLLKTGVDTDIPAADIYISSQSITKETQLYFGLIGILSIDNPLNQVDFRAAEKAFEILLELKKRADNQIIIQTNLSNHYCFKALIDNNPGLFYDNELKQRKDLGFPPFSHLIALKIRGKNEERVKSVSALLHSNLTAAGHKAVEILPLTPAYPPKLRENYYWQIMLKTKSPPKISAFLKTNLKKLTHSGIIVTIDVDPI